MLTPLAWHCLSYSYPVKWPLLVAQKHLLPYKVKQVTKEKNFSTTRGWTNSVLTNMNVNFTSLSENDLSSTLSCYHYRR